MSKVRHREIESSGSVGTKVGQATHSFINFGFAPRGLRRQTAAHYVGVSATKFDEWVAQGLMPEPKQEGGVVVWDRLGLDAAFDVLPDRSAKAKFNPYAD